MAQYDGSIRINTEINTRNASAQLMSLENRIAKTADKIAALRSKMDALKDAKVPTQEYKDVAAQIEKAEQKFNKLLEKQEQMQREGKDNGTAWERLNAQIEEVGNEIRYAQGELQNLVDTGKAFTLGSGTQEYANYERQIRYLQNDYDVLIQRRNEFEQRHNVQTQAGGYERLHAALEGVRNRISGILHPIESMKSSFSSAAASIKERAAGIAASIINGISHPLQTLRSVASSTFGVVKNLASGAATSFKKIGSAVSSAISIVKKFTSTISSVASGAKKAASAMLGLKSGTGSANNAFKSGLMSVLKYGFGIRSVYALINKFRTGVKEGFQNLAQYSAPVNAALSSLMSALTQLKNSLATAFAPILTAVAPALTTLINLVSKAVTAVGMLIAALTGQSTFVKASKVQQNYAASLGKTAGAAKKAGKEAKKAAKSLAAFDKLTVLSNNDADDSGSGGGGGGGGGGGVGDMFETVDIPSKVKDFANMLKKAWKDADFTEIGALIGQKLKEGLEAIPWDKIQHVAEKIGKSLATLINGFVEVSGLGDMIGYTIAQAINTGLIGFEAFAKNLHWDSVGTFVSDMINGVLKNIDWETALSAASLFGSGIATALNNALTEETFENIGYTLGMLLNTALAFAENFADTFDWSGFGSNVASGVNKAVETADWEQLGRTIGELITGVLTSIDKFLVKTKWFDIGKYIATSLNELIKATDFGLLGKTIADSLNAVFGMLGGFAYTFDWSGLGLKLAESVNEFVANFDWEKNGANLGQLAKGVLDTIVTFLEETDWQEIGRSVAKFVGAIDWSGLTTSIAEGIGAACGGLAATIWGFIEEAWDEVIKWWEDNAYEDGEFTIDGLLRGISDSVKNIGKWVREHIVDPFIKGFKKAFGIASPSKVMKKQGGFIIDGLKNGISEAWKSFKEFWSKKKEELINKFDDIKEKFLKKGREIIDGIKSGIKEKWTEFKTYWTEKKNAIVDKFKDIKDKFKTKGSNIISGIKSGISEKWSDFYSDWGEKKKKIIDKFEDIKDKFNTKGGKIISGIKSGISEAWSGFSKFWSGKKDDILKIFSNIKEDMKSVGKKIIDGIIDGIKSAWNTVTGWAGKIKDAFTGAKSAASSVGTDSSGSSRATRSAMPTTASVLSYPSLDIPYLASGAVIRGGDPFMAVLGDQPRNQTNIETPLPTMVKAFKQAIAESGGAGGEVSVRVYLGEKDITKAVKTEADTYYKRTGKPLFGY